MQADWMIYAATLLPTALIAGYVRGLVGLGGPLVLLPVMNLFHASVTSVSIALAVSLIANVKLIPDAWRDISWRASLPLAIGSVITLPIGTYALLSVDAAVAKRVISATILLFALIMLCGWRYRGSISTTGYAGLGALSGFILGATAIAVQLGLFLNASQSSAIENRANYVFWSFYSSVIVVSIIGYSGEYAPTELSAILFLAPAFLVGVFFGTRAYRRLADENLRRLITLLIAVVALVGLVG